VLACGGFEPTREWRTRYLGPGWDWAKVRGTRFNPARASAWRGDRREAHAAKWVGVPRGRVGTRTQRPDSAISQVATSSRKIPLRSTSWVNATGKALSSKRAGFRNYRCKIRRVILEQPGQFAGRSSIEGEEPARDEYKIRQITKVTANHFGRTWAKSTAVMPRSSSKPVEEIQCRRPRRDSVHPKCEGRRKTEGLAGQQEQLGQHDR